MTVIGSRKIHERIRRPDERLGVHALSVAEDVNGVSDRISVFPVVIVDLDVATIGGFWLITSESEFSIQVVSNLEACLERRPVQDTSQD